jgi:selenide,water dikinase
MATSPTRLTALAHGGGCGCKLSPRVLRELLADMPAAQGFADLIVGIETGDDAAVYRLNDEQAVIATTDFFMPIVDDPYDFGRIAATNALSDVYAMGGKPLFALAILGMPLGKLEPQAVRQILAGGAAICKNAGIPVAGGHSIDAPEPIYGLAVIGLVHPDRVLRNSGARAGDALILSKPLGIGVISAALKSGKLSADYERALYCGLIDWTTRLNAVGAELAGIDHVHAVTDVTGFGLLGHALEMCRGSQLRAQIHFDRVPLLDSVDELAQVPYRTGAAMRNWASYCDEVALAPGLAEYCRDLLCDPQTSGGLLISVAPDGVDAVLARLHATGFGRAAVVGKLAQGEAGIDVV